MAWWIEKIQAQIIAEVDDQSFKKASSDVKLYARDTKKELDKSFLFKLQLDKAQTKIQLDNARKLLREAKKDWDKALTLKYTLKTDALQSKLSEASRKLRNFWNTGQTEVSRLWRLFDSLKIKVGALLLQFGWFIVWIWAIRLWTGIVRLWDQLEQANISFTTMLWSADNAQKLLVDLAEFAKNTPFELTWIRQNAKQLLAMWIAQEEMLPTLKALWDISAWLSVPLERLALNFWQVKVQWKLTWRELRDFSVAWVPLISELAKNLWIAEKEVSSLVSAWKIWFPDVEKAFTTMTSEWWKFFDLMDKQSESLSWRWSNLKDQANILWEKIWTAVIPALKKWIEFMSKLLDISVKYWRQIWFLLLALWTLIWAKWLLGLFTIITRLIPAIKWIAIVNWLLTSSVWLATFSMKAFIIASAPLLWTLALITTALWGAKQAYDAYSDALDLIDATNTAQKSQDAMFKVLDKWVKSRKDNIAELKKQNEELTKSDDKNAKKQIEINNKKIEANKKFLKANLALSAWENSTINDEERNRINKEWIALMKEAWIEQKKLWWIVTWAWEKSIQTLNWMNKTLSDMKEKLWDLWTWTDEFNELQSQIIETEKSIKSFSNTSSTIAKAQKKASDEAEKRRKKEIDQRKKFDKYLTKKEEDRLKEIEERGKKIEKWWELVKDYYSTVRTELEKSQDKLDDFDKQIEDSWKKLQDLKAELRDEKDDTWIWLAERRLEIEKELRKLEQENPLIKKIAKNTSEKTLEDVWKWTLWWGITWNEALEFKKLQEELAFIELNANLVSEEQNKIAEESKSARIIRESEERTKAIEEEIQAERVRLLEIFDLKDEEKEVYKSIDEYRTNLETNFTALLAWEVSKRISELEKLRQKAIETANAIAKAWITTNNVSTENNVNVELQGTWFSSIDAQNIWNALSKDIDLSSKWINK